MKSRKKGLFGVLTSVALLSTSPSVVARDKIWLTSTGLNGVDVFPASCTNWGGVSLSRKIVTSCDIFGDSHFGAVFPLGSNSAVGFIGEQMTYTLVDFEATNSHHLDCIGASPLGITNNIQTSNGLVMHVEISNMASRGEMIRFIATYSTNLYPLLVSGDFRCLSQAREATVVYTDGTNTITSKMDGINGRTNILDYTYFSSDPGVKLTRRLGDLVVSWPTSSAQPSKILCADKPEGPWTPIIDQYSLTNALSPLVTSVTNHPIQFYRLDE